MAHYYLHMQHSGDIEFDSTNWTPPSSGAIAAARAHVEPISNRPYPVLMVTPLCDVDIANVVDITVS
jgi:hypothetical protein